MTILTWQDLMMPRSVAELAGLSSSSPPSGTLGQLSPSRLFLPASTSLGTSGLLKPGLLDRGELCDRDNTLRKWGLQAAFSSWGCRKAGLSARWLGSTRRLDRKEKEARLGACSTGESGRGGREVTS